MTLSALGIIVREQVLKKTPLLNSITFRVFGPLNALFRFQLITEFTASVVVIPVQCSHSHSPKKKATTPVGLQLIILNECLPKVLSANFTVSVDRNKIILR